MPNGNYIKLSPHAKTLRLNEVWSGPLYLGCALGSARQCRDAALKHYGARKGIKVVKVWEVDRVTRKEV
jgi:hypothetical protein